MCMDLPGDPVVKNFPANAGDAGSIPELWRSPREVNGNPLQYSCLGNPWTEEPGGLYSMGLQRVGHEWTTNQQQQTSYIMDYILYNAKIFSESFKPCLCLFILSTNKKPPWYIFLPSTFPIFHSSLLVSPLTYFLLIHVAARRAGWTLGMPDSWSADTNGTFSTACHCFSLLVSYILSDHLPLCGSDPDCSNFYVPTLWTNWHWTGKWEKYCD